MLLHSKPNHLPNRHLLQAPTVLLQALPLLHTYVYSYSKQCVHNVMPLKPVQVETTIHTITIDREPDKDRWKQAIKVPKAAKPKKAMLRVVWSVRVFGLITDDSHECS